MATKEKYGMQIKEYLFQIYGDFEKLSIVSLGDLRNELENNVSKFVYANNTKEEAERIMNKFVEGTRDQQCLKMIVNDFKRANDFGVNEFDSEFNLFYYSDPQYLLGFEKHTVRNQEKLKIKKFSRANPPKGVRVFWSENGEAKNKTI